MRPSKIVQSDFVHFFHTLPAPILSGTAFLNPPYPDKKPSPSAKTNRSGFDPLIDFIPDVPVDRGAKRLEKKGEVFTPPPLDSIEEEWGAKRVEKKGESIPVDSVRLPLLIIRCLAAAVLVISGGFWLVRTKAARKRNTLLALMVVLTLLKAPWIYKPDSSKSTPFEHQLAPIYGPPKSYGTPAKLRIEVLVIEWIAIALIWFASTLALRKSGPSRFVGERIPIKGVPDEQCQIAFQFDGSAVTPKDRVRLAEFYEKLAEEGNTAAQNNFGLLNEQGIGVLRDYESALKWFNIAAANGEEIALRNLNRLEAKADSNIAAKARQAAKDFLEAEKRKTSS